MITASHKKLCETGLFLEKGTETRASPIQSN